VSYISEKNISKIFEAYSKNSFPFISSLSIFIPTLPYPLGSLNFRSLPGKGKRGNVPYPFTALPFSKPDSDTHSLESKI
jgi:hypothetical protein